MTLQISEAMPAATEPYSQIVATASKTSHARVPMGCTYRCWYRWLAGLLCQECLNTFIEVTSASSAISVGHKSLSLRETVLRVDEYSALSPALRSGYMVAHTGEYT